MNIRSLVKKVTPEKYHPILRKVAGVISDLAGVSMTIMPNLLVDPHTWIHRKHITLAKALGRTARYKLAGAGMAITQNEKKLLAFRYLHTGQRAFILGNGPSLNKCDLSMLKNEITFAVNNIFLNYEKMRFHPTYYVVEDILVAEDRAPQINEYHGPKTKFFGNYLRYCIKDAPDTIWLNVCTNYENYPGFPHFSENVARMIWVGGTVAYMCLQLAYYMGFQEIYLVGFDHSYTIPADAVQASGRIISQSDDPNHFHKDYFGKGYRWHDPRVDRMEAAFRKAKTIFESDNRKIFNATIGGHLEVYERVDYLSLF